MAKKMRIWLIVALSLVLIGGIVFTVAMSAIGWDFTRLSSAKYQTKEYTVSGDFHGISINTKEADVRFVPSENGECRVVCFEKESAPHTVEVQSDKLVIVALGTEEWHENIFDFVQETLTVYLPQKVYATLSIENRTGDVEVSKDFLFEGVSVSTSTGDIRWFASANGAVTLKTSTGDIFVENISAGSVKLSVSTGAVYVKGVRCTDGVSVQVSTGKAYLTDIVCKSFTSMGNTGDITLKNVQVAERLSIERSTGDVRFDRCDGGEIVVKTGTGDIEGTLLSGKEFICKTSTGEVEVPKNTTGGKCALTTTTGDIEIRVLG